jgi:predicted ArsR family transcriptional regulator
MQPTDDDARAISAVAALADGVRKRLYDVVRDAGRPISREEAARRVGISRKLAAFHLDKLVTVGLLVAGVAAEPPRRVGRAPKVYRPVDDAVEVSVPPRAYADLASILVEAIESPKPGESPVAASHRVAARRGRAAGSVAAEGVKGRLGVERAFTLTRRALVVEGYEPYEACESIDATDFAIRLRNCPFHALAAEVPGLVCQVNGAFLQGLLDGLGAERLEAVPVGSNGECCAEIRARAAVVENGTHDRSGRE